MSLIEQIQKPERRPLIATFCGDAGTGKSSLAASFPKPIFIRAEDGVGRIHRDIETPDSFPVPRKASDIYDQLLALLQEEHDYQTAVIDSVTAIDSIFTADILERDGRAKTLSTAFGGYGAGYDALASMHGRVRKAAGMLNQRRGMTVIFIAHADLESVRLPDVDDYMRYSLRLSKKSLTHYVDDVDFVGYVRLVSALRGDDDERKKIISNGEREIVCHATAASVSKNGFGITEPLEFEPGTNPLAPFLNAQSKGDDSEEMSPTKPKRQRKAPAQGEAEIEQPDGDV